MASLSPPGRLDVGAISKMKVAEIKKELKARGLSTTGTKTELIERLQATASQNQDIMSEDGNAESEILDEDEVLGGVEEGGEFDDDDLTADAVLADEPKVTSKPISPVTSLAVKRPAPTETSQEAQPKKRVLVRPTPVANEKENNSGDKKITDEVGENDKTDSAEKKVIKLSGLSMKERLELRAQKFGVQLSESAKKEARASRFNVTPAVTVTETSKGTKIVTATKITFLGPTEEVMKKRADRFGCNVSSAALKVEEQEKLKKRQERFGASTVTAESVDEKKKLRAERFKL